MEHDDKTTLFAAVALLALLIKNENADIDFIVDKAWDIAYAMKEG
jgi:hypothetical protein